jgi:hypothetical protein
LDTLLTIAKSDGSMKEVDNPRWLKAKLDTIKAVSRCISAEETRIRAVRGFVALAVCGSYPKILDN